MPKLKLGAAIYALFAILQGVGAAMIFRGSGYEGAEHWFLVVTATAFVLSAVLFGIGAVTRRGLVADDGPWICENGWLVVIGLVGVVAVAAFVSDTEGSPFPNMVSAFLPGLIRRCQEKYYEGIAEAERELSRGEPDEVRPPTG